MPELSTHALDAFGPPSPGRRGRLGYGWRSSDRRESQPDEIPVDLDGHRWFRTTDLSRVKRGLNPAEFPPSQAVCAPVRPFGRTSICRDFPWCSATKPAPRPSHMRQRVPNATMPCPPKRCSVVLSLSGIWGNATGRKTDGNGRKRKPHGALDFDATIAQLSRSIGSPVNVQVLGDAGMVLNIEGVLGPLIGKDTSQAVCVHARLRWQGLSLAGARAPHGGRSGPITRTPCCSSR